MAPTHFALPEPGATEALARSLARLLRPGDTIALEGELGAGKTTLVRALAQALGVDPALVSSPTFVFINLYPIPAGDSPLAGGSLIHADAYRLSSPDDLDSLGWDTLTGPDLRPKGTAAALIEWPQRLAGRLPPDAARLVLTHDGPESRLAELHLPAAWASRDDAQRLTRQPPKRCPKTGAWVEPLAPTYPFASAKARDADLFGWLQGTYITGRPADPSDQTDDPS